MTTSASGSEVNTPPEQPMILLSTGGDEQRPSYAPALDT